MVKYSLRCFCLVVLISLASVVMLVSVGRGGQQARSFMALDGQEEPPKTGLRVVEVYEGSPAQNAGLKPMDTIGKYGRFTIVDSATYFTARDAYENSSDAKVEIVYWRGRERFAALVSRGRLGIEFNEYNPVAYQLDSLMQKFNITFEVPEYYLEDQIAKGTMPPPEGVLKSIQVLVDRAAQEGSLTPAQILVARINMIADNAPAAEIKKQAELVKELISTQPQSFTDYLGSEVFYKHKRFRPAVECFRRSLDSDPSDVNIRLNLGNAYFALGMFDEADAAADYVLGNGSGLSEYGHAVAFQIKAIAALGHRDFASALAYAGKAFHANPTSSFLMSLWHLTAARSGDLEGFYEIIKESEQALPKEYANLRCRTDAVEAYILVENHQVEKARQIAARWIGTDKLDSNARYWKQYPGGDDIVKCWKALLARS